VHIEIMKTRILALFNLFAFAFHLILSFLVQMGMFSKSNMSAMSAKYDTVFTPAGLTFSIWGLIYLALTGFCFYHLYISFKKSSANHTNLITNKIGPLFIINNLATAFWLVAFLNEYLLFSVLLMLIQLISLILIHVRLNSSSSAPSIKSKLLTHIPLSIYFGWISIATIANISAFLKSIGWNGGINDILWVNMLIGIACILGLFMILIRKNMAFGIVVLWALYGIVLKRQQVNAIEFESVIQAAFVAFILIFIGLVIRLSTIVKPAKEF
jgi:hypothetical protein